MQQAVVTNMPPAERNNRFFDDIKNGPRSLSTDINNDQKKKYHQLFEKSLKRERSSLSHTRYNKMKTIILREVRNAIQEAEYEPTASVNEINMIQSIIQQNEEDLDLPDFEKGSIIIPNKFERNTMVTRKMVETYI